MVVLKEELTALGLIEANAMWSRLAGGRTNFAWYVKAQGQATGMVVKLFAKEAGNPLFPNDATAEALILRHLEGRDLAPQLLNFCETELGPCLIYRHLDGKSWTDDTAGPARLLAELHAVSPPGTLRIAPDGTDQLTEQTHNIMAACPPDDADQITSRCPAPHCATVAPSGDRVLLHGDPVTGNLIVCADGHRLIDWQCPAQGDPCEDIALFLSPAMQVTYRGTPLSDAECAAFLTFYANPAISKRYRALAPWYHWRMAAYCLWKKSRGDAVAATALALELGALDAAISALRSER